MARLCAGQKLTFFFLIWFKCIGNLCYVKCITFIIYHWMKINIYMSIIKLSEEKLNVFGITCTIYYIGRPIGIPFKKLKKLSLFKVFILTVDYNR